LLTLCAPFSIKFNDNILFFVYNFLFKISANYLFYFSSRILGNNFLTFIKRLQKVLFKLFKKLLNCALCNLILQNIFLIIGPAGSIIYKIGVDYYEIPVKVASLEHTSSVKSHSLNLNSCFISFAKLLNISNAAYSFSFNALKLLAYKKMAG